MISSIRHKGLKLFFENDNSSKLQPHHVEKIRRILYRLDEAETIDDLNIVGWALHPLSGDMKGHWAVKVNGNYRITFRFEVGNVFDVDYIDYH